jgi:hypothetical protein
MTDNKDLTDEQELERMNPDNVPDKLTQWANEPTITQLKQDITDTANMQNTHVEDVEKWLSNLYITDSAKVTTPQGQSEVVPKLIRKQAEWRYASLSEPFLASPDIFNVYPISAGDEKRAQQNALVLNNQFNTKIDKVGFMDSYVRDLVDVGTAVIKVGWESEEEEITEEKPVFMFKPEPSGELANRYQWLLELQQTDEEAFLNYDRPGLEEALNIFITTGQAVIPVDTGETETVTRTVETKNQPTLETLDSRNVIVAPCGGDYTKAGFIAEKFKSSLSALKKDGNYKNLDAINIEAASPVGDADFEDPDEDANFNYTDKPRKEFVVYIYYGYWDINKNGVTKPIVAAWVNDVLIRMEENPYPDRMPPYIFATYMPKRRSVHGEPDGELLEDNQKIIGAITRGVIDLMGKSANSQTGVRKDMLDLPNRRKFNAGKDYEFNSITDPRQGFYTHVYPEVPQSAYSMIMMNNNEAESMSGVKAFNSGITGDALGKNVANGRSALDAASKREIGILRRVAKGMTDIGRKIIAMNAEFLSEKEIVRVTADEFVAVRRDDLAGNYDLEIAISTPEEDNRKAEELAFMLQTSAPNSDPAEIRIIRAKIARLRKMPDLAKQIEEYEPQPDPLAVAKAEKEVMLLDAQIAKEQALAAKHLAEAEAAGGRGFKDETQGALNLSKAETEPAKQRNLHSDSDKKDLDFVEQELGVTQERDLEKDKLKQKPGPTATPPTK